MCMTLLVSSGNLHNNLLDVIMEDAEERNMRKIKANESSWERNQIKSVRIKGEEYTGYKGREVPAKKTGPGCR